MPDTYRVTPSWRGLNGDTMSDDFDERLTKSARPVFDRTSALHVELQLLGQGTMRARPHRISTRFRQVLIGGGLAILFLGGGTAAVAAPYIAEWFGSESVVRTFVDERADSETCTYRFSVGAEDGPRSEKTQAALRAARVYLAGLNLDEIDPLSASWSGAAEAEPGGAAGGQTSIYFSETVSTLIFDELRNQGYVDADIHQIYVSMNTAGCVAGATS